MISRCKEEYQNYLTLNLHDPMTNAKNYCSLLKHFYNGKKVPIIPPLLIDNRIISDSEKKANHFNNFFASHGTTLNNTLVKFQKTKLTQQIQNFLSLNLRIKILSM